MPNGKENRYIIANYGMIDEFFKIARYLLVNNMFNL